MSNNGLDLLNAEWLRSPAAREAFRRARVETPVVWQSLNEGTGYWAILRHADIVSISSKPDIFSSAKGVYIQDNRSVSRGALLYTDPPDHRRLRNAVARFFLPRNVERLGPWIRAECQRIFNRVPEGEVIDFVGDIAAGLPLNLISEMIDIPPSERARFLGLANALFDSMVAGGEHYAQAAKELGAFGLWLAQEAHEDHDLFCAIQKAHDGSDRVDEEEFSNIFMQIAAAAVETTRTAMGEMAIGLATRPELLDEIRTDTSLVNTAVDEFLRTAPPVYLMRRTATADTAIADVAIKAGQKVVMYYLSANFDDTVFAHADAFDIRRRPNPHLTFGAGQHICLGLILARAELRLFLEELVHHVTGLELVGEPETRMSAELFSYQRIPMRLRRGR